MVSGSGHSSMAETLLGKIDSACGCDVVAIRPSRSADDTGSGFTVD